MSVHYNTINSTECDHKRAISNDHPSFACYPNLVVCHQLWGI